MTLNNILEYKKDNINIFSSKKTFKKWEDMFNFKNIDLLINIEKKLLLKKCEIKKESDVYICLPYSYSPINDLSILEGLNNLKIEKMKNYIPVEFNTIKEAVFYIFIDEIVNFLLEKEEVNYDKVNSKFSRSSILENNKNSFFIEYINNEIYTNMGDQEDILNIFKDLKINSLELPYDFDKEKTLLAMHHYKNILDKIKFPIRKRNFNLKFKKLGNYKVNGFYCLDTNTILVDPRKIDTFYHELGHLIYDNNIKIYKVIKAENSEDYADKIERYIKNEVLNAKNY